MPRQSLNDRFPKRQLKPAERTISFLARRSNLQIDGRPTPTSRALARGGGGGTTPSLPGSTQNVQTLPDDPNNAAVGQIFNVPGGPGEGSRLITVIQNGDGSNEYRDVIRGRDAWPAPYLGQWGGAGTANGQFGEIRGITVDLATGNVYVSSDNRIQKFSANGTYISTIATFGSGNGQVNTPWGLAHDGAGNLYVADSGNHRIQKFVNNVYSAQAGSFGSGNGQFNTPKGIAYDATAAAVVVADSGNNRLQSFFAATLNFASSFTPTPSPFNNPNGVRVGLRDVFAIVNEANHQVVVTNRNYATRFVIGAFGASKGQFNAPYSVEIDRHGNFYATDSLNNRVQVFDANGIFQGSFGQLGSGDDDLTGPTAIAITNDYIYVADSGNSRVVIRSNPAAGRSFTVGEYSGTWAPAVLGADAGQFVSVTILGAVVGDYVEVAHSGARSNSFLVWLEAYVSAANTVTVHAYNRHPTLAQTLGSGTLKVRVTR